MRILNTGNLFVADPYNDNHIRLFREFEESNNIQKSFTSYLEEIKIFNQKRGIQSKEVYNMLQSSENEINYVVFTMANGIINDSCFIRGERDRKICELYFAPLNKKSRPLLKELCNYVFNRLGMEQIYVSVNSYDKSLKSNLELRGFENIGKVNGQLTFLIGKEDVKEVGRVR